MKELFFEAIAKINEETAYAVSTDFNALFRVNLITKNCSYVGIIPEEKIKSSRLYTKAIYVNGKIYFIPLAAEEIAVYKINENSIYKLPVNSSDDSIHIGYRPNRKFSGATMYHDFVFLSPCTYPGVVRINTITDQISYYDQWIGANQYIFRKSLEVVQDSFYVPSTINNLVLKFDMNTCKGHLYQVGKHNAGCWSMCQVGNNFWLAPQKQGPIICWNPLSGSCSEYNNYPDGFQGNGFLFTKIYLAGKKLCLVPALANMGISFSIEDCTMEKSGIADFQNHNAVTLMFELDDYLYLKITDDTKSRLIKCKKGDNFTETISFLFTKGSETYCEDFEKCRLKEKKIIRESDCFGLEKYINFLAGKI